MSKTAIYSITSVYVIVISSTVFCRRIGREMYFIEESRRLANTYNSFLNDELIGANNSVARSDTPSRHINGYPGLHANLFSSSLNYSSMESLRNDHSFPSAR